MKTLYTLAITALLAATSFAQEPIQMRTVVTVTKTTKTFLGEQLIGEPLVESVGDPVEDFFPVSVFNYKDASSVWVISFVYSHHQKSQLEAISPGVFAAPPGEYLVFEQEPIFESRLVESPEPPVADTAVLAQLSADLANRINDQPTREALGAALSQPIAADIIGDAKSEIQSRVRSVLAARQGESRQADWLNDWRRPIQKEVQRIGVLSLSDYAAAIKSVADGLIVEPEGSIASVTLATPAPASNTLILSALQPDPQYELVPVLVKRCRPDGTCYQVYEYQQVPKE